jgi:hypothetical protein
MGQVAAGVGRAAGIHRDQQVPCDATVRPHEPQVLILPLVLP